MALLNRLFGGRGRKGRQHGSSPTPSKVGGVGELSNDVGWEPPPFSRDRIRVLVFRECEWRGRKLLFDWKSVRRIDPDHDRVTANKCKSTMRLCAAQPCNGTRPDKFLGYTEVAPNGTVYQYVRPQPDVKMLGEMIFGSVAMSYKGETTKIHSMRSPPQMMFSKVTPAPMRHHRSDQSNSAERELNESGSFQNSVSECILMRPKDDVGNSVAHSVPVDVPAQFLSPASCRISSNDDNLEAIIATATPTTSSASLRSNCSFGSVTSLIGGGGRRSPSEPHVTGGSCGASNASLNRSGSLNSLNRRWHRTMATSIEFGLSWIGRRRTHDGVADDASEQRTSNGGYGRRPSSSSSVSSRTKLGISMVISLPEDCEREKHFQTFFFSHIALVESHVNRLSADVVEAYTNRSQFVHLVVQGVERLQQRLYDLYTAPRFPRPVWSNLMSVGSQHHVLCLHFITEFMSLVEQHDTKDTNFFVSTLLTAVLMHHLSWVPTVTPPGILPNHSFHEKHMAKWLNVLAQLHPYNPLWVQLGDLYGALGFPCKMAKTIVVGSNSNLVRRLLYALTYFVRCCEVYENIEMLDASPFSSGPSTSVPNETSQSVASHRRVPARTLERRNSDIHPSSSSPASSDLMKRGLMAVAAATDTRTFAVDVEIQEGEGDEVDDDVFHGEAQESSHLQVRIKSCPRCRMSSCSCWKSHRCGVVYDDNDDDRVIEAADGGRRRATYRQNGFDRASRDSGIQSSVDLERTRSDVVVGRPPTTAKRTRGKVLFSIGNVPLKEMCNGVDDGGGGHCGDEDDRLLVCTCGKHYPRVGTVFTKRQPSEADETDAGELLSSVKHRLLGIDEGRVVVAAAASAASMDARPTRDGTLSQIPSMACDSGIQSCEESSLDLADANGAVPAATTIRALDVSLPRVKLEHVRNVGKSKTSAADEVGDPSKSVTGGTRLCRPLSTKGIDYERTHSMFDEYFDENVELNMLDEDSFQATMKRRRQLQRQQQLRMATKSSPPRPTSNGCHDSRDSGFDGNVKDDMKVVNDDDTKLSVVGCNVYLPSDERTEFLENAVELRLPRSSVSQLNNVASQSDYVQGFGRSLSANYADRYLSDFALQGTSDRSFGRRLLDDLHVAARGPSVLDEPVDEAVSIVASADDWSVELVSSRHGGVDESTGGPVGVRVTTSQLVVGMTESLLHLWKLKMSPEFCLMHLEDRLQEFYFKSRLLADYLLEVEPSDGGGGVQAVSSALGVEASDLPLLLAIASTHSPQVTGTYELAYR